MTTKKTNQPKPTTSSNSNKPDLLAYTVEQRGEDQSSIWTQVGAAWVHKDNQGYDVRCKAFPIDGRLTLRFQSQNSEATSPNNDQEAPAPTTK